MSELIRFGVSLPSDLIKSFDKNIRSKGYNNRSEAIRDLMRDYLVNSEWEQKKENVIGTVTLVYCHDTRELVDTLNAIQHDYHDNVICTTHIHLDNHNCLEVVILKGSSENVRSIADRLISTRGVKHGKLVCSTTGENLR